MARSKQHKHKKQRKRQRQPFYEALSAANIPVPTIDNQPDIVRAGLEAANRYVQIAERHLASWWQYAARLAQVVVGEVEPWRRQMAQTTQQLQAAATPAATTAWQTTTQAGRTAATYTGAGLADLAGALRRLRGRLWSRRARALYLAIVAVITLGGFIAISTVTAATLALYTHDIASPAAIMNKKKTGTTIVDRGGQVLFQGYGAQSTTMVKLADVPQSLKDATLTSEDPHFYDHAGFSWRGTARAAWVDLTHGDKAEGGSTLTQQLVKNAILTSTKTFERKAQEVILAMELERKYSKDQILEMYLNETYYGQGSNGIAAAAQTYFHKPATALTLGEAALLAGLPLGPNRFDPNAHPEAATDRRNFVLDRMAALGKITAERAKAAKTEPIIAYPKTIIIKAPHFVFYVLDQLRAKYGEDVVENGGITVKTTLDLGKQEAAQRIVQDQIAHLAAHNATNGGLIAMTPGTGDIISMVGSINYDAPGFGAVNVTLANLQPGSSFKPIAYATAFQKGWNGSTQVDDMPISLPNGDGTMYVPQNYDLRFRGQVTLRRALGNSLNIPAIKVIQFAGLSQTIDMAHALGITTLNDRGRYGVSLVLGGGEVRPIDMATVYGTFANAGVKVEPRAILSVTDRYGQDVTKPVAPAKTALDPQHAYMISSILSDNTARTEEFGPNSPLKLSRSAAAKTGTTNDFRDNWTVGYTPNLVTAVWVGNNDHSPMSNVDGITGAAPIWHNFMEMALTDLPIQNFTPPAGITTAKVCARDGGLANPWDTGVYDEAFPASQPLTRRCNSAGPIVMPAPPTTQPIDASQLFPEAVRKHLFSQPIMP